MKKVLISFLVGGALLMTAASSRADDIKNNFQANLNQTAIDALTKDLGALMAGGSFHTGKALGFPIGFDVGAHATVIGLQKDDAIIRDDRSTWVSVFGQAEIGLPARINVIGRVGTVGDGKIYGGGLRYGILRPSIPGLPALSVSALYNQMDHDFFKVKNYSANAVLSFDLPIVRPYVGAGYDLTKMNLKDEAFTGLGTRPVEDSSVSGYRAEIGANVSFIPFTYFTAAVGMANGKQMVHAGAGVTF